MKAGLEEGRTLGLQKGFEIGLHRLYILTCMHASMHTAEVRTSTHKVVQHHADLLAIRSVGSLLCCLACNCRGCRITCMHIM